jgi:hypothetical protein
MRWVAADALPNSKGVWLRVKLTSLRKWLIISIMIHLPLAPLWFYLSLTGVLTLASQLSAQQLPPQVQEQNERESHRATDRELYDDSQVAAKYWYESRNPKNLPAMDDALEKLVPAGLKFANHIIDFDTWEKAQESKAYHTAGAVLLAKAYTLLYYGDVKKAASAIGLIESKFRYSMCLYEDRSVVRVRERLRFHEHACMLYAAMSLQVMGKIKFPAERDEFDGPMQALALENMAVLRLKEGNIERLEHFFNGINQSELKTSSGEWAIHIIMNAIKPLYWEDHANAAWKEIDQAIKHWQNEKPSSVFARLAEARFALHYAEFALAQGGTRAYPNFRDRIEKGLRLMKQIPKTSPAWYETNVGLMVLNGCQPEEFAPVFVEGLTKYSDYAPLIISMFSGFVESGEHGREVCARAIEQISEESYGGVGAQVLRTLLYSGGLRDLQPRLNVIAAEKVIRMAVKQWPDSYKLRSDLGLLAVTLGKPELAREIMKNMGRNWNRATWKGREDMAITLSYAELTPPKTVSPPLSKL